MTKTEKENKFVDLPEGVELDDLKHNFETSTRQYRRAQERAATLDAVDRGYLWEAIKAVFPKWQILPDTNHVAYVKSNLVASIYTVGKEASLLPTSEADKQIVEDINNFLSFFWSTAGVGFYQLQAGERAALMNIGITQVGWDTEITGGTGNTFYKGAPVYRTINPLKFMRDPFANDLESSGYCMIWETFHKSVLLNNPLYKDTFKAFLRQNIDTPGSYTYEAPQITDKMVEFTGADRDYYKIIIHWVRDGAGIHEIHTVDNRFVLAVKRNIRPNAFPFAICHCNLPNEDLFGTSEPAKIFANSLTDNLLKSIIATAEHKNQHPPRFINGQSGLNVAAFAKYGNDADRAFVVSGDASRAVHYQQYPPISNSAFGLLGSLSNDINMVTGIDERYTGRDSGSVTTTGGITNMLAQSTLIDAAKILLYEEYCKQLTKLTLGNLLAHASAREYIVQDPYTKRFISKRVDFPSVPKDAVFNYEISVSSHLPKTKERIAEFATELLEAQAQYQQMGQQVDWITPEEWLYFQDNPMRELMTERMNLQRHSSLVEDVTESIVGFAELTSNGMDPEDAIMSMAQGLQNKRMPMAAEQAPIMDMGAVAQGMPPDMGMM